MRLNHALAVLLLGAAVSGMPAVASAADVPAPPVTVSNLDVSTPGHLTGTVTTDAPAVWICFDNCQLNSGQTNDGEWLTVPADTHELDFDLPTWGHSDGKVIARACSVAPSAWAPCPAPSYSAPSEVLVPTDLVPTITSPTDTTIGRNGDDTPQQVDLTVSDPGGGGNLRVLWSYTDPWTGNPGGRSFPVPHEGPVTLDLADGVGKLLARRCAVANVSACTDYTADQSPTMTVARGALRAKLTSATLITSSAPDSTATIRADHSGDYALDWSIEQDGTSLPGTSRHQTGSVGEDGTLTFTIPGTGLPDGNLTVVGRLAVDDPDFGSYSSAFTTETTLMADRVGPAIEGLTVSRTAIHPKAVAALSAYRGVTISIKDSQQVDVSDLIEIRDADGATVRHIEPWYATSLFGLAEWDGRDDAGAVVPAGSYTVVAVDKHGNPSLIRNLTVSHARGVLHTYRGTVSASGSQAGPAFRGRCSTLRRPSLRGWTGSLGFYANTLCARQTWAASAVSTLHRVRLPSAVQRVDVEVQVTGGAARSAPRSRGLLRYLAAADPSDSRWVTEYWSTPPLGTHTGPRRSASGMIGSDRYLYWGFATAFRSRYDVKSFTVTVRYYNWT